jgi:thioredoxin reductase
MQSPLSLQRVHRQNGHLPFGRKYRRGVSACAVSSDKLFFRNQEVAIVGGGTCSRATYLANLYSIHDCSALTSCRLRRLMQKSYFKSKFRCTGIHKTEEILAGDDNIKTTGVKDKKCV